jgi:carbon-monoxide dehydrogenase medium subunit
MIPPLLVLDAEAELVSPRGSRIIPLAEFFVGPGQTILAADEILASVRLPEPPSGAVAAYHKHSPRRAMDLAVVGVAVLLARSAGQIQARIALGAVAPTPLRVTPAEGLLAETQRLDQDTIAKAARLAAEAARPISDVRASAEYRIAMVKTLTERALTQLAARLA